MQSLALLVDLVLLNVNEHLLVILVVSAERAELSLGARRLFLIADLPSRRCSHFYEHVAVTGLDFLSQVVTEKRALRSIDILDRESVLVT